VRVAVAGGTGLVGATVVARLTAAGHEPVVLARAQAIDLVAGTGLDLLDGVLGPVAVLQKMRIQPIAAAEVADRLVGLALGGPQGIEELAGPREEQLIDLARRLLRHQSFAEWLNLA
jgi:uncharacterized protein YbjT (DUF2867 family)